MKLQFNKIYFIAFILLLLTEIAIAFFFTKGFIRHTVGDFLVVILLYCFFKSFLRESIFNIAIGTLVIAYIIEFLQLTNFLDYFGLRHNKWANLILGNSFSIQDLVAYTLGIILVIGIELKNSA